MLYNAGWPYGGVISDKTRFNISYIKDSENLVLMNTSLPNILACLIFNQLGAKFALLEYYKSAQSVDIKDMIVKNMKMYLFDLPTSKLFNDIKLVTCLIYSAVAVIVCWQTICQNTMYM